MHAFQLHLPPGQDTGMPHLQRRSYSTSTMPDSIIDPKASLCLICTMLRKRGMCMSQLYCTRAVPTVTASSAHPIFFGVAGTESHVLCVQSGGG